MSPRRFGAARGKHPTGNKDDNPSLVLSGVPTHDSGGIDASLHYPQGQIMDNWDAIIIRSGAGGLNTAVALANAGKKGACTRTALPPRWMDPLLFPRRLSL